MIYGGFAGVYDAFMGEEPYDRWGDFIMKIFARHGIGGESRLLLDLCCGTGSMAKRFMEKGFDVIGVDASPEMLAIAREKNPGGLFLCQDAREFELYGTVDAILCLCDSMNYILDKRDVRKVFRLCHNYLNPGGLMVMDINSPYKYQELLGDNIFGEVSGDAAYIWENTYDPKRRLNEYNVTFFVKDGENYRRFQETHYQRAYTPEELIHIAASAGFHTFRIYGDGVMRKPDEKEERIFLAFKKKL